jgi:hypothetical protein
VLTGTGETRLPNLDYANRLLDRVFHEPSGRNLIKAMSDNLQPGEQRVERIKNMFALSIAGVRGQSATYTVTPVPGKAQELSDLLRSPDSKEISIEPKRQRRGEGSRPRTVGRSPSSTSSTRLGSSLLVQCRVREPKVYLAGPVSALLTTKRTRNNQVDSRELHDAGRNSAGALLAGDYKDGRVSSPLLAVIHPHDD